MNYYKKTEAMLYNYKYLVAEIKNLEIEINELEYVGCKAIGYDEKTQPTNKFNSTVENEVVEREKELTKLKDLKFKKENQVAKINNAIESLDERSKQIIRLKYLDKLSNTKIANRLGVTEEWIWRLKSDAVNQLSRLILITN